MDRSARAVCIVFAGLSPVQSLKNAVCGGVHCYDGSAYCCTDRLGEEHCCFKSLYEEAWFWSVLVIGILLVTAVVFCACRALYRYHNAGQYTKLRRQQTHSYGAVSSAVVSINHPPLLINSSDPCGQLPSYASVMDRPPPAYSETADTTVRSPTSINRTAVIT